MDDYSPDPARGVSVREIINGTRCSPLTLKEFEEFLLYEEHSVENLLFVVWYRDYCARFAALSPELQSLSAAPEVYRPFYNTGSVRAASTRTPSVMAKDRSWWEKVTSMRRGSSAGIDMEKQSEWFDAEDRSDMGNDVGDGSTPSRADMFTRRSSAASSSCDTDTVSFRTAADPQSGPRVVSSVFPSRSSTAPVDSSTSPDLSIERIATRDIDNAQSSSNHPDSHINSSQISPRLATTALRFVGLAPILPRKEQTLPAVTPLPFVEEISLVLTTFILPGGSRELNLDARLKKYILRSLQPVDEQGRVLPPSTTHPHVFKDAMIHCFDLMEQSLPKYLQYAGGNVNKPKALFWYGVGLTDVSIGIMIAMLLLYYTHSRWWRIFSFVFIQFGVMQIYSASRYFCSQVHGRTSRQLYPWELTSAMATDEHERPTSSPFPILDDKLAAPSSPGVASFGTTFVESSRGSVKPKTGGWMSRWRRADDGKVVAIFGPERVVEDEYIKYLHNRQIKEILIVGAVVTLLFEIAIVAIPQRVPL